MTTDDPFSESSEYPDGGSPLSNSSIATLDELVDFKEPAGSSAPRKSRGSKGCPNCGSTEPWGTASWCPSCGYYPSLGRCVQGTGNPLAAQEMANFWEVIPIWGWILGIGVVAVFVTSLVANSLLPETGHARLCWTLAQFSSGLAALFVAHLSAFMHGVLESEKMSPFDLFIKPMEVWRPAVNRLPRNPWRFWCLGWGATAAICAVAIIGGVQYSAIFEDWGFERKAAPNIVQAVVNKAREEREGAESLDQAMKDFVGEAEVDDLNNEEEPVVPLSKLDCVIVGYVESEQSGFSMLLLASVIDNKLRYVGNLLVGDIPDEVRRELMERMPTLRRSKPFVKSPVAGTWLQPLLMCRVTYEGWKFGNRMKSPKFQEMLADVH